jgi:hypothetical protein
VGRRKEKTPETQKHINCMRIENKSGKRDGKNNNNKKKRKDAR